MEIECTRRTKKKKKKLYEIEREKYTKKKSIEFPYQYSL